MASLAAVHAVFAPVGDSASGGGDGQKPKRARTSKPKVKTGCNNCKQRRIKCDELRPECYNCVRSKKICSGYPPPPRSARPFEEIRIAPKPIAGAIAAATPPVRDVLSLQPHPRRVAKQVKRNASPITPVTPQSIVMPGLSAMPTMPTMPTRVSINLPFTAEEGLYFQLFRERTASELSGFFDSAFWERSVLQECHGASAIRHAVVALGALYKTLDKTNESPPGSPSPNASPYDSARRHWEMAFRQYSNALSALIKADSVESTSNRTRLMASVLLACFDSFVGDHQQAIVQIQNGLRLLEKLRMERRRAFLPKPEEPVEEELIQMFTRLAIQAKSYDMAFHFPQPYVVRLTAAAQDPSSPSSEGGSPISTDQSPIPERFSTVQEARIVWDRLVERIFRFTETMFVQARHGVMGILPTTLAQRGMSFKKEMDDWALAFEHILQSRTAPGVSSQQKACIAAVKMHQIMSSILFMMTFSDSELHFDKFTADFKQINDLAIEVVGDEERRAAAKRCPDQRFCHHQSRCEPDIFGGHEYAARHIKPSFSADLGIVPPLYVVATKCRDPHLRRQAIQLLRSSARREGMWDSELTARIGMWIAEVEEEGLFSPSDFSPSPTGSSPVQLYSPRPWTSGSSLTPPPSATYSGGRSSTSPQPGFEYADSPINQNGHARQSLSPGLLSVQIPRKTVPAEKRVMVRAVEFSLRDRSATIQLGSRNLRLGTPDLRTKVTRIMW
ncbi:hypothetical protein QBC40DRAFT_12553 [Triangularia verruculosa]|uniref:Zn(2)-C6 fungal-type domain-containing protein n=1 Tax=Triangularia verruculosa TaxID=2587418 RepID=A0AAN7AZ43_9PEZI|nr:hypothetical protein QBC40DRAFT_12553 [Triangularia verruculosa]